MNLWLKQRPRLMLCCSKADRGILIGSLLQVNRYLHIGPPISTAPRVASTFAGRGAASAASMYFSDTQPDPFRDRKLATLLGTCTEFEIST